MKQLDHKLLIELMDKHLENVCIVRKGKHYNLISNSELCKIIEEYIKRKEVSEENSILHAEIKDLEEELEIEKNRSRGVFEEFKGLNDKIKAQDGEIVRLKATKSQFVCEINELEEEIAVLRKET